MGAFLWPALIAALRVALRGALFYVLYMAEQNAGGQECLQLGGQPRQSTAKPWR